MTSTSDHRGPTPGTGTPELVAALLAKAWETTAGAAGARPAEAPNPPWLATSGGFASFTVPADHVRDAMGDVSLLVVEGDFGPSFNRSELGLTRYGDAWTATIGPLPPGWYRYRLVGDDTTVLKDPTNHGSVASDPTWSTFLVPGEGARLLADVPEGRGGAVGTVAYPAGPGTRQATVWTPPGYHARRAAPYPVLYLLTGTDGHHTDWADLGRAPQILDNLWLRGRMAPMVVVMAGGTAPDHADELDALVRAVGDGYRVAGDPAYRALAGVSTGGTRALEICLAHPGRFAHIGVFAGLPTGTARSWDAAAINEGTRLLRLYTGNATDPAHDPTLRLMRALERAGVRYESDGVHPAAGHTWKAWQDDLADFVPRLFGPASDPGPSAGHPPLSREFTPPPPGTTPTPWLSGDGFVTVETGADLAGARHVTVWGNWAPGGSWLRVPLNRSGDRWRGTVGPLAPGFYHYQFFADLVAVKDIANPTSVASEPTWSTFLAPGTAARQLTDVPDGRGGRLGMLTYTSTVAGEERTAHVWTPPGYDRWRPRPYPVLYLQHGSGQSYPDWVEMGRAKQILDHGYLDGDLVPMVVVMGNGNVPDFTGELLENIVPAARAAYNICAEPAGQALAGLSMGGFQTYEVLKAHPGRFAYVGTFSAGLFDTGGFDAAAVNRGTTLLRIYTGNVTDFLYPLVMATMSTLDGLGIRYEFAGVTQGPHGWDTWQKNLVDFLPRLFRDGNPGPVDSPVL